MLLEFFHSVAVVLTLVETKQIIIINIHKQNNTKTQYKQYKTQCIQVQGGSNMTGTYFFFVTIIAHHSSNSQTGLNRF